MIVKVLLRKNCVSLVDIVKLSTRCLISDIHFFGVSFASFSHKNAEGWIYHNGRMGREKSPVALLCPPRLKEKTFWPKLQR